MRLFMRYFIASLVVLINLGIHQNAEAQVTVLICNYEEGGYFGTVKVDMKKRQLTETNELMRVIRGNFGQKYDPEKNFNVYPIVYVSDALIRTEKLSGLEIEIDRRSLRMRWIRPAPPEWFFNCIKSDKAF